MIELRRKQKTGAKVIKTQERDKIEKSKSH